MDTHLLQLTESVWVFPHDPDPARIQPSVGVIIAGESTVLVDGGNSPRHARRILDALDDLKAPPVRYVIYTHSRFDHFFGAQVFGAQAIAQELCRQRVQEMAGKPWSFGYLEEEIQQSPDYAPELRRIAQVIEEWRGFRIIVPTITFTSGMTLFLDGRVIEIEHVGGAYAPDLAVVRVPDAGVIFTSDAYYRPPESPDQAESLDRTLAARLLDDERMIHFVAGHRSPVTREALAALLAGTS